MALILGIDTGGTFTDAVIVDDARDDAGVVAAAKSPTTHHDLAEGVRGAIRAVLVQGFEPARLELVSVSTTLATNALVEGHGEPAALVSIGFAQHELERSGALSAVAPGSLLAIAGGHDAHGQEAAPLDLETLRAALGALDPSVSAIALAGQFSVRNPAHERRAGDLSRELTGLPVTTSHRLSARLDGPRRALTAVLNARLIGTIDRLIRAVREVLDELGIAAPLMVVRGDGSLVSADFATDRPIETVLSGPAASVVGALHLATVDRGLVVDVGGTTTDVAVIREGRPVIADRGAIVGGYRTMVEAVDMATIGLGGDSEVRVDTARRDGPVVIGPERAVPVGRLALAHPAIVAVLERQLAAPQGLSSHARFLLSAAGDVPAGSDDRERAVLESLAEGPRPESEVVTSGLAGRAVQRLRQRGLVRAATLTPTDALAVVGAASGIDLDTDASRKAAALVARQSSSTGAAIAVDADALARHVIAEFERRSAEFVLRVALDSDSIGVEGAESLIAAALAPMPGVSSVSIGLADDLVAMGAPADAYYPSVAAMLGCRPTISHHAAVANAIGAVVGFVSVRHSATITQPTKGQFRVHLDDQPTYGSVDNARAEARRRLESMVLADADRAGAASPRIEERWSARTATVADREVFVEGRLTVEATARPRF